MTATAVEKSVQNGVNVAALLGAREALTEAPEAAGFTWRAQCTWVNGTHSQSTIKQHFGLGEEQSHRTEFKFDADHPEIFASEDNGAAPVELILAGLASCLIAGAGDLSAHLAVWLDHQSRPVPAARFDASQTAGRVTTHRTISSSGNKPGSSTKSESSRAG